MALKVTSMEFRNSIGIKHNSCHFPADRGRKPRNMANRLTGETRGPAASG